MDYKEFPRMMFNVMGNTIGVNTQGEMDSCLLQGWSKTPYDVSISYKEKIKMEIKWHESEIARLKDELDVLEVLDKKEESSHSLEGTSLGEEVVVEVTEEKDVVVEEEKEDPVLKRERIRKGK